jgi:hypothetical protein
MLDKKKIDAVTEPTRSKVEIGSDGEFYTCRCKSGVQVSITSPSTSGRHYLHVQGKTVKHNSSYDSIDQVLEALGAMQGQ